jgi:glycosyltransferase involved in cell wall biosynthesis
MVPDVVHHRAGAASAASPSVCIVGPFPPPSGGMANQCQQLIQLLKSEGIEVKFVRTNSPYQPIWAGKIPVLRSLFRLFPYLVNLWRVTPKVDVVHLLANSGWAWHLFSTPVILIGRLRGTPVIVNYRGGNADTFFAAAPKYVLSMLAKVSTRVTPSVFLQRVFAKHGLGAVVIPNIIDLSRFSPRVPRAFGDAPHIIVTRNLEPIYDIPTAIRAFVLVKKVLPGATMTVAGSGPELANLQGLVSTLRLADSVKFAGRIDNASIPSLYASADCMINSSTVDNMPISILEAFASGVPVISTDAGGIPDLVGQDVTGLLVPIADSEAIAREVLRVLQDADLAANLTRAAFAEAQKYAWPEVRTKWLAAYVDASRHRSAS